MAAWLLGRGDAPPAAQLRAAGLGAYAYTTLAEGDPERDLLRMDFVTSVARRMDIRTALFPLLSAWQRAGIPMLLFKGFHLSEFVYPVRGTRAYADVDILIPPERAEDARRLAEQEGWRVNYDSAEVGQPHFHTAFELVSPTTGICVDAHRYALGALTPGLRLKRHVTGAVWARARERTWEGLRVWEMDPVDALLVGLVLGRAWGADGWGVKAHDALDWRLLRQEGGMDDGELEARSRELGCARTLRLFRERFDPERGRLELGRPPRAWVRRARTLSAAECFHLGATVLRVANAPGIAADAAAMLPYVVRARKALRETTELGELLPALTPAGPEPGAPATRVSRFRTTRGVRWASRLLRRGGGCDCLVRSLALYVALREQGWPVSFVSGVRLEDGRPGKHAWVELDGRVLPELRDFTVGELYRETFRYPSS
ncbi:lasso peptide biosynthesis B2 protein [Longimicrobium sp.]|uniref:lasso peptide biosynthesis B2 protein n=1 Tax=Longimicrobium sp. TaxID=2029185 RepID=UPI003B3B1CC7